MSKLVQVNVISTYISSLTAPQQTTDEFIQKSQRLNGYGCHCSPYGSEGREMFRGTKGKPLDHMDKACHAHNSCYRCIEMEFGQKKCDYRSAYNMTIEAESFEITCNDPPGSCEQRLCECDREMFNKRAVNEANYN